MNYRILLGIALSLILFGHTLHAQYTLPADPGKRNITPPSPDTWQFMKYGEYPVSKETGVPGISIPIYTITNGELSLPISLSYHAGGIKVDEIASWVGLGWTLNAGGMISRVVKGLPDETGLLFMKEDRPKYCDENGILDFSKTDAGLDDDWLDLNRMRDGIIDTEPDQFNFSIAGQNGTLYLDVKSKILVSPNIWRFSGVVQPKSDIAFTFTVEKGASPGSQRITSVLAVTPEGIRYSFDLPTNLVQGAVSIYTSWYLTLVQSANQTESISISYKDFGAHSGDWYWVQSENAKFSNYMGSNVPIKVPTSYLSANNAYTEMKLVDHIDFATGKVVFNTADDRLDDYQRRLTSIDIFSNFQSSPIKSFSFHNNHYFLSTGGNTTTENKRLRLDSLIEVASDGKQLPPHVFTYRQTGNNALPARHSFAQDYWGYSNGKTTNTSSLPLVDIGAQNGLPDIYTSRSNEVDVSTFYIGNVLLGSANKEPDANYMTAGIIDEIKYPTGGSTKFLFEPNTINYDRFENVVTTYPDDFQEAAIRPGGTTTDYYSDIFSPTTNSSGYVQYSITDIGYCPQSPCGTVGLSGALVEFYEMTSATTGNLIFSTSSQVTSGNFYVFFKKDRAYRLHAKSAFSNIVAVINITWKKPPTMTTQHMIDSKVVGGLRVTNIQNFDSDGTMVGEKIYSYNGYTFDANATPQHTSTGYSSGIYNTFKLPEANQYLSYQVIMYDGNHAAGGGESLDIDFIYTVSSFPSNHQGFPSAGLVNYEYVTETVTGGMGKTIYHYDVSTKDETFYGYNNVFSMDRSWLRGQLLDIFHYNNASAIVRQEKYQYETVNFDDIVIKGARVDKYAEAIDASGGVCLASQYSYIGCSPERIYSLRGDFIRIQTYTLPIQWKRMTSKTEIQDGVQINTTYFYDQLQRHTNVVAVESVDSDNRLTRAEIRYAHEMNNASLLAKNIIGISLESDSWSNGTFVSGSRLSFGCPGGCSLLVPFKYERRLGLSSYQVVSDLQVIDANGNPEQLKSADGSTTSFKWDYTSSYPLAKVANATAQQIAFTSFESGSTEGGWTYSLGCSFDVSTCPDPNLDPYGHTQCYSSRKATYDQCVINDVSSQAASKSGKRSFIGTSSISKSSLPAGNYKVSFWAMKTGSPNGTFTVGTTPVSITSSQWQLYEINLTSVTSVTLSALAGARIDDLRLQPAGSLMTTYTATPLIGVTTVTDANNKSVNYEYDNMNRLKIIRDNKLNIVKRNTYTYKDEE
jgi:hypothetical protein